MEIKQSTCNYCSIGCNLDFYVEDNEIKKIIPTKGYPVNDGFSCIKGLNLDKQGTKYAIQKLPLIRNNNGDMEQISWDEAFKTFSNKIKSIQEKYGKESTAYLSTGQITVEEMALLGHIGRIHMGMFGDGNTRLCMASAAVAHKQSFGFDAPPYTLKDLELSDTIIFFGANPIVAHPILWSHVRKNKDAKIIVIDPRESETAKNADIWVDIKPRADIILCYTIANVLIEKGWIDDEYIENYSEGFEGFKNHVKKYTLENVEKEAGISKERVLELAEIIHNGKKVSFWWTIGINQGYQAVRTIQSIINLAVMTGNIGREGTGANSITGQSNAMGSRLYSNTTSLYAGRNYANPVDRKEVADILGIDEDIIPKEPTIPYNEIIDRINDGEIKMLWVVATNPRHSWTNNKEFEEAIKKLEFFVVQDLYSDTDSAKVCDLFLPCVPSLKKQGTQINTERRISAVVPVIEKEDGELTDYDIFLGIGKALGIESLEKWKTPQDAFELMKKCSKGMPCDITGINYEELVGSKGIQWPFREGDKLESNERRLFEDNRYFTSNGKVKFIYEDVAENPHKQATPEFPYILNTGRATVGQWHTQTRTREIGLVNMATMKDAYVLINPELGKELELKEGEKVIIASVNGQESKFDIKFSDTIKKNHIYAPLHYIETNNLTESVFDTYSKEPSYKFAAVNIKKIER